MKNKKKSFIVVTSISIIFIFLALGIALFVFQTSEKKVKIIERTAKKANFHDEYGELYSSYIALPEEEREKISVIPIEYDIPVEEIYSEEMEEKYEVSTLKSENIPSSYDLRGYIDIKVERQRDFGNCYAYASLTSVETNLALTRGIDADFSEIHAAILTTGYSGNLFQANTDYYANLLGPVYEKDYSMKDIYDNTTNEYYSIINKYLKNESITSEELTKIKDYAKMTSAEYKVSETTTFPTVTSEIKENDEYSVGVSAIRNAIKKHIMEYGSVAAYINSNGIIESYNGHAVANGGGVADHTVSIVGWDDNYSVDNFPSIIKPASDGAYLCLNSWGESWGEDGYFWVSYCDGNIESSPVGVVKVEDIKSNVSITSTKVEDTDLRTEISNKNIEKGRNLKITIEVALEEIIDENNLSVKVQRCKEYITNLFNITIGEIEGNTATIILTVDSQNLNDGENRIEVFYGADKAYTSIEILDDFEYTINADYKISITKYIGVDYEAVIPTKYLGYDVYEICDNAFKGTTIESLEIQNGVKLIGDYAFADCVRLENVSIGNTITSLGDYAFSNCKLITNIEIPSSVTSIGSDAFKSCSSLASITLNDGVKTIGNEAFYLCTELLNVVMPNSVTSIDNRAFFNCSKLQSVTLSQNLTTLGESAFGFCFCLNNVVIPDSIEATGSGVFSNCNGLTNITFSKNMKEIANSTFYSCLHLESITIPEGIEKINDYAFYKCSELNNISLPSTLKYIGNSAFSSCSALSKIVIPNSVTSMGENTFNSCTGLTNITLSSGLLEIPNSMCYLCSGLKNVVIPEGVKKLGDASFGKCTNLESLELPNSLETIGRLVISYDTKLTNVIIPKSVTTIDFKAFMYSYITEINIPKSVKTIGKSAFASCTSLSKATIYKETTTLGQTIFSDVASNFVLYCEENSTAYNYAIANSHNYHIMEDKEVIEGKFEVIEVEDDDKTYIDDMPQNSTVQEILENYKTAEIYKDGEKVEDTEIKMSTGMQIKVGDDTYDVVVSGDISGDGEIDDSDLLLLARYMVGFQAEQGKVVNAYLRATDVYDDGEFASDKDLLKLAKDLLK